MAIPLQRSAVLLACCFALSPVRAARADDLSHRLDDPRSVGRAGATNVSADSGAALFHNPGGMVRRSQARLVLATGLSDRDASFTSQSRIDAPIIGNRTEPLTMPLVAFHQGDAEGRWVVGVALMQSQQRSSLAAPAFGQPAEDVERLFPHRYGGTRLSQSRRTLGAGAALRIGDAVGLGASVAVSQVSLRESRRIWAGFAGRDPLLSAERDLELVLRGEDLYNPGATVGALLAPPELPFEFALSLEYRRGPKFRSGRAELNATSSEPFPSPQTSRPESELRLRDAFVLRGGARYLGARSFVEVAADYQWQTGGRSREDWHVSGMQVIDESTASAAITRVPALIHSRSHLALRAAVDYEVVLGFLWLTAGYAYTSPGSPQNWRNPVHADLGGHTLAAGLEASYENYIMSVGYARRLERERTLDADHSDMAAFNPFAAGTGAANAGTYAASSDQLGFALEVSWD